MSTASRLRPRSVPLDLGRPSKTRASWQGKGGSPNFVRGEDVELPQARRSRERRDGDTPLVSARPSPLPSPARSARSRGNSRLQHTEREDYRQNETGERADAYQRRGGAGGKSKGKGKGAPQIQGMEDFHVECPSTAWALEVNAKATAMLLRKDRIKQAMLFDAVEVDNVFRPLTIALKEKDSFLSMKEKGELADDSGSLGFNMLWVFATEVASMPCGSRNQSALQKALDEFVDVDNLEAEAILQDLQVESVVSNASRTRLLLGIKQWRGRKALLDSLFQLGATIFKGPAPPGYLERASSAIANSLSAE